MNKLIDKNEDRTQIYIVNDENKLCYYEEIEHFNTDWSKAKENERFVIGEFEDDIWVMKNDNYNVRVDFSEVPLKLKKQTKYYALYNFNHTYSTAHIRKKVNTIAKFSKLTQEFNIKNLNLCKHELSKMEKNYRGRCCSNLFSFFNFIDDNNYKEYKVLFEKNKVYVNNVREIPGYSKIIKFDVALDDYFNRCSRDMRAKYFPIFLWWKITTIIPMRPSEFAELSYNCCSFDNGKYYLEIMRRKKGEKSTYEIRSKQIIEVNKNIYDLIEEYKHLVNKYFQEERQFLVSYRLYNRFLTNPKQAYRKKSNPDFMELTQLHNLLADYTKNVVNNMYGFNLNKFSIIDTRHIAIMNLFLQGVSPFTIATMAGHSKITTQFSYLNHVESYIDSYTLEFSNYIKQQKSSKLNFSLTYSIGQDELLQRSKIKFIKGGKKIKIEGGYCIDSDFPNNCANLNCIDCCNFVIDNLQQSTFTVNYRDVLEKIESKLKEQELLLKTLHETCKAKNIGYKDEYYKKARKGCSKEITRTILKKSIILSNYYKNEN